MELQGDFGIDAGSFTKTDTQQGVNSLSLGARGEKNPKPEKDDTDPQNVLSNLKGHVLLNNGVATFSDLSFGVPGALAQMRGTYDLISEKIDLHGTLKTEAEVSKTTHGIKSLMLKVLDPFFKNKPGGYLAPVKITGTYDHPQFGLDLGSQANKSNQNAKAHTPRLPGSGKAVTIRLYKQAPQPTFGGRMTSKVSYDQAISIFHFAGCRCCMHSREREFADLESQWPDSPSHTREA